LSKRNDKGALWENFLAIERLKTQSYKKIYANNYFWRTWDKKEVDWLEEREEKLFAYEFKYSNSQKNNLANFKKNYPDAQTKVVSRENYWRFLL
jgi:uncharacterized protein